MNEDLTRKGPVDKGPENVGRRQLLGKIGAAVAGVAGGAIVANELQHQGYKKGFDEGVGYLDKYARDLDDNSTAGEQVNDKVFYGRDAGEILRGSDRFIRFDPNTQVLQMMGDDGKFSTVMKPREGSVLQGVRVTSPNVSAIRFKYMYPSGMDELFVIATIGGGYMTIGATE